MTEDTMRALRELRKVCIEAASEETSWGVYLHNRSPLFGHCLAVSWLVRGRFGGDVLHGVLRESKGHFWNRLPDGTQVDLTSDQFPGGDGWNPHPKVRAVAALLPDAPKGLRRSFRHVSLFKKRVMALEKAVRPAERVAA
jgi:hypothetical protein